MLPIKPNKANKPNIERFLSGFKYSQLYKNLCDLINLQS